MPFVSRSPFPMVPRLPPGMALMDKIRGKIKTTEKKLKTAKKASADHKKQMMVSRYTPDGYKKALAEQKKLDANVKTLQTELARLQKALFSIG
jgi:SMC interacting uncharacterized protein involved in chromosome segregation